MRTLTIKNKNTGQEATLGRADALVRVRAGAWEIVEDAPVEAASAEEPVEVAAEVKRPAKRAAKA